MSSLLLSLSALMFGATLVIAIRHMRHWRVLRAEGVRAALPLHVWVIAMSYDLLLLGVAFQSQTYVRWWHPWVYIPALILGMYAMVVIGRAQTRD